MHIQPARHLCGFFSVWFAAVGFGQFPFSHRWWHYDKTKQTNKKPKSKQHPPPPKKKKKNQTQTQIKENNKKSSPAVSLGTWKQQSSAEATKACCASLRQVLSLETANQGSEGVTGSILILAFWLRGFPSLEITLVLIPFPKELLGECTNWDPVRARMHSIAKTQKILTMATKHTQHAPSTRRECDYLYGWIKKNTTTPKNQTKKKKKGHKHRNLTKKNGETQRHRWERRRRRRRDMRSTD